MKNRCCKPSFLAITTKQEGVYILYALLTLSVFALVVGFYIYSNKGVSVAVFVCIVISLVTMFFIGLSLGSGLSLPSEPDKGEVRELICSVSDKTGVKALLRKPDGDSEFRLLKRIPPKIFVVKGDGNYVLYPEPKTK